MNYNDAAAKQYNPNRILGELQDAGAGSLAPERTIPSLLSSIEKELSQLDHFQCQIFETAHRIIDPVPTAETDRSNKNEEHASPSVEGRLRNILRLVREANTKADRNISILNGAV